MGVHLLDKKFYAEILTVNNVVIAPATTGRAGIIRNAVIRAAYTNKDICIIHHPNI